MGFFELFTPDIQKMHDAGDVRGLLKALGHAELPIARKAAAALSDLPSPDSVIPLIKSLSSPDKDIRRLSAAALGATRDPRAIPAIFTAAEDEDIGVRIEAVKALGELRDAGATALLTRLTNDPILDIRMAAVSALGHTQDPAAVDPLLHTLIDPHYGIRELSAQSLDALGWLPVNNQDKALYHIAKREWSELISLRSVAGKTLIWALKDDYFAVRQGAALTLGKLKDIRASRALISALSDDESSVRMEVVSALSEISDSRTIPALVRMLDDDYIGVRVTAVSALEHMAWKPSNENEQILYLIAKERWLELADIGKKSTRALAKRLNDPYYSTRKGVAKTLRKLGENALEPMLISLNSTDPDVRSRALWILGNIGNKRAVGPIVRLLNDDNPVCREEAIMALGEIGDPRAIPFLTRTLSQDTLLAPAVIRALGKIIHPASVRTLVPCLKSTDPLIRLHTIRALGESGDKQITSAIGPAVQDPDPEVRAAAVAALCKFPSEEVLALIKPALEDSHPDVRYAAVIALPVLPPEDVIPLLVQRLGDADPKICRAAAQTLDHWNWHPVSVSDQKNFLIAMDQWQDLERFGFLSKGTSGKNAENARPTIPWGNAVDPASLLPTSSEPVPENNTTIHAKRSVDPGMTIVPGSVQSLIRTLGDRKETPVNRWKSAEGLGELGDVRGVEPLIVALKDRDPEVRWRAALSLGTLNDDRALESLCTALREDDQQIVRVRIAEALGKIKKPVSIKALVPALGDVHPFVRNMAVIALGEIGTENAVNAIMTGLLDTDETVRETVIATLLKLGNTAGRTLVKSLRNKNPDVKKGALTVLMLMKPEISSRILVSELENSDCEVRQMVVVALDSIDWQPENPYQNAMYLFAKQEWTSLESLGKTAEGILIRGTTDNDPEIRRASTELLGSIGGRHTVTVLTEVLHDENREVRLSSIKTLLKMRGGESSRFIFGLKKT